MATRVTTDATLMTMPITTMGTRGHALYNLACTADFDGPTPEVFLSYRRLPAACLTRRLYGPFPVRACEALRPYASHALCYGRRNTRDGMPRRADFHAPKKMRLPFLSYAHHGERERADTSARYARLFLLYRYFRLMYNVIKPHVIHATSCEV